ncbi:MAG: VWA domain-containing protein, partial [Myxococcales bacterium]|nr:VWA domain-containing protein [Myxococcales bacterium]
MIVILALAFARPTTTTRELAGARVAIVIDVSASMTAVDEPGGETRIARARAIAREQLFAFPRETEVMLIEAGREPRIASLLDRDKNRVASALAAVDALDVEGDIDSALALAVDRLKGVEDARIVLVTDGAWGRPVAPERTLVPVTIRLLGSALENTAIVRSDVRIGSAAGAGEEVQAFLAVQRFGSSAKDMFVTMRRVEGGDVLDSRRLSIEPGAPVPVLLSARVSPADYGAGLVFEIAPGDGLAADDVAYGRVPQGPRLPVVLASPKQPSAWLERGLRADPGVDLRVLEAAVLATTELDPGALIVADGFCPPVDVGGADLLVMAPPSGRCLGVGVAPPIERPVITSWEQIDPRLRFLTLDGVNIASGSLLTGERAESALVRTKDGGLIVDASTPSRTITMVGFDVGESDWPLKASFVLFMRNVTELARSHRQTSVVGDAHTGAALRIALPARASDVTASGPRGDVLEVSAADGLAVIPAANRAGLYRVRHGGAPAGEIIVPVNLSSAAESDTFASPARAESTGANVEKEAAPVERRRELAWLAGVLALAVLLLEVTHHTRRPRRRSALSQVPPAPERRSS